MPGLPQPKQEYQGMDYGSELPIPSNNFATSGASQIMNGASRMTGSAARRSGGDVADARYGGASDMFRGAGQIVSPVAAALAVPTSLAGAGLLATGVGGGYVGGKLLKGAAQLAGAGPGGMALAEDVGTGGGGLLAGGAAESPKIGAFLKGAAKAAPTAMVRSGPYGIGGALMHALGHNKSALAADAVAAAAGLPTVIRGGMAEAAGKPWLGAGASRLFGVNKPQQAPPPNPQGLAAKQEAIRLRGLMDEAPSVIPQGPSPRITAATELPSGRPVGGIFNQTAPSPTPAPNPQGLAAKQESIRLRGLPFAPPVRVPPSTLEIPAPTQLPSGRPVGGIWNQNKPQTPAEIIAADAKSKAAIEALKARQAAKQNQRPAPTPKPAEKPTTPSENMAAKMAAQDAAGQERTGLMNDVVAQAEAEAAAAVKDLEWRKRSGTIGEKMTKTKQDALIAFAAEKGKPMTRFTESEYNDLVSEFNAAGKKRATGKPFKMNFAGADYNADGEKYGRDVEMTLRHFNNMRLGKK
jgi:hypothetical protein